MNKLIYSCTLLFLVWLSQLTIITHAEEGPSVNIAMRNNALNAAVKFYSAQKNCKPEEMIKYSVTLHNSENQQEYYQEICNAHPLQTAEITDLLVVSPDLALVSAKLDYTDMVIVKTTPIMKIEGKWRIMDGLVQQEGLLEGSRDDIKKAVNGYFSSVRTGDKEGLEKYGMTIQKSTKHHLHQIKPSVTYKIDKIYMLSDHIAAVSVKFNYDNQTEEKNYIVYKQSDNWKLFVDRMLVTTAVPKSTNTIEVK